LKKAYVEAVFDSITRTLVQNIHPGSKHPPWFKTSNYD